ncbi:testis-expressed protein 101 [Ochotona curzoniae]|uniref:testis-expressed protein 101 n=1 Tax=Ochotona curzoniae TaxID=130825 RepID=UPI001B34E681|nr:testis-expressed protein 101 [Ochotona curzoniae]
MLIWMPTRVLLVKRGKGGLNLLFLPSPREVMRGFHLWDLLFLVLLGACGTSAHSLSCQKSMTMQVGAGLSKTFNWTAKEIETCDSGALCHESMIVIKAGTKTALVGSKGCTHGSMESITFIQHSAPPDLVAISYSNYCEDMLCNNREEIRHFGDLSTYADSIVQSSNRCPTCLALGTCSSAPSLPCVNGSTRCYEGKLEVIGGDTNATVEIRGCTAMTRCRLMSRFQAIGPMLINETCSIHPFIKPRFAENGSSVASHFSFGVRATAAIAAAITCPFVLRKYLWSWVSQRLC